MWGLNFTAGAVIVRALFPAVRCAVFHPLHVLYYGTLDTFDYIRRKQYNLCHTGDLDMSDVVHTCRTVSEAVNEWTAQDTSNKDA